MSGVPSNAPTSTPSRTPFTAGRDLTQGKYVRAIASGTGVVLDSEQYLLVTSVVDKKGNRQLVDAATGDVFFASPASVWSV